MGYREREGKKRHGTRKRENEGGIGRQRVRRKRVREGRRATVRE